MRSHGCGDLRSVDVATNVQISGWVDRCRDHGGVIFIDLRDQSGIIQIKVDPDQGLELFAQAEHLRNETVLQVEGIVLDRPSISINEKIKTGKVEVLATKIQILNTVSANLPFSVSIHNEETIREELRLRYRYLDLRRERMN
ncbi:MAG TPA: OB-fold nucleic acid binding domain-containing protein, partial [Prochlorococcaceae cyanobacterium AMR_MDS_5431]|nr:OB-fold nucleic acid binding domain-containing protein [Prochlorococcaceae cyanobacterium AMR_MDS_5431]